MSKALFSPTVLYSYKVCQDWWERNGAGHEDSVPGYDWEGCDEYGYDKNGRDRAWKTMKDYENDPELFEQIKKDYNFLIRTLPMI